MGYEDMSDFEINKAVANKYRDPWLNLSRKECSDTCLHIIESNGGYGMAKHFYVDYCNNPTDMWTIMIRHGISAINLKDTTQWLACVNVEFQNICMSPDGSDNGISSFYAKHECYHTNPLRAAAIVYLKMMEK